MMEGIDNHPYEAPKCVNVSELRQWLYCPRVVWFGRALGAHRPTSGAMRAGIDAESERQRLEQRRSFHQFNLEASTKLFQVPVRSEQYGLSGRIDCLIELTGETFESRSNGAAHLNRQLFVPVEYKSTFKRNQQHNTLQLVAYSLMIEEATRSKVSFGFVVLLPQEEAIRVPITFGLKRSLVHLVQQVRDGLSADQLPWPTPHRGKCVECEFRRFCNDV